VKLRKEAGNPGALVAFTDIKSASKAHKTENEIDSVILQTEYSEPTASGIAIASRTVEPDPPGTTRTSSTSYTQPRTVPGRYTPSRPGEG
jgi:hypothetical protein